MKILISGSTGHIGSNLLNLLQNRGHEVFKIVRFKSLENQRCIYLSLNDSDYNIKRFEGFDVVIHLAGENLLGRWSDRKKQKIRDSRVESTKLLCRIFEMLEHKPITFLCASAVGFYGDRGDLVLTEDSIRGEGFLPDVCYEWENATKEAADMGIRVVNIRTGMVLDSNRGALKTMLIPFKLGIGGNIGSGEQYWSWISIDDEISAINFAIENDNINGPLNLVSPEPLKNKDFTSILGNAVGRPTFLKVPEFALNIICGEMSGELLLSSARVKPQKLEESGYRFKHESLNQALRDLLS